jgi:hypothetical protein
MNDQDCPTKLGKKTGLLPEIHRRLPLDYLAWHRGRTADMNCLEMPKPNKGAVPQCLEFQADSLLSRTPQRREYEENGGFLGLESIKNRAY